MNNVPTLEAATVIGVRRWLFNLQNERVLWHMEDSALDIQWCRPVTQGQAKMLEKDRCEALDICEKAGVDIFEFYPREVWGEAKPFKILRDAETEERYIESAGLHFYPMGGGHWHILRNRSPIASWVTKEQIRAGEL